MKRKIALATVLGVWVVAQAGAQSIEQSLAKLAPEDRSEEACTLRGLELLRREPENGERRLGHPQT